MVELIIVSDNVGNVIVIILFLGIWGVSLINYSVVVIISSYNFGICIFKIIRKFK